MITAVASCPHPPLLLPGRTGRPVAEVEQLRQACHAAIADVLASRPERLVIVGGARPDGREQSPPLSIAVGRSLLAGAAHEPGAAHEAGAALDVGELSIAQNASIDDCLRAGRELAAGAAGDRLALLVMADGSARRGLKAPGYLDERAADFDAGIERALAAGEASGLAALDPTLAAQLLVAGRAAWQLLAGAVAEERVARAQLRYSGDPFGVWYPVAVWTIGPAASR